MSPTLHWGIYLLIGLLFILLAGLRPVGLDPDSENYEDYFINPGSIHLTDAVEWSYLWICDICRYLVDDVHAVFFVYAILAVVLKLYALPQYGSSVFLLLTGYICYYYPLQELMQIRSGVLGAFILLGIPCLAEGKRLQAGLLFLLGTAFHTSGLALFPLLFLNNQFSRVSKIAWLAFIPVCYALGMALQDLSILYNLPYIGNKIEIYSTLRVSGRIFFDDINILSPFQLLLIACFYYLMHFADGCREIRYFPLLMKIFALSIGSFVVLQAFPVIAERISMLYRIVIVVLLPYMAYTVRPRWAGITLALLTEFIFLNYILRYVYNFTLFLKATV